MGLTRLFAYGTLRPGGRLHHLIEHDVFSSVPASAPGYQMWLPDHGMFPVIVAGEGVVHGDVLEVLDGPALRSTIRMEESAGYVAKSLALQGLLVTHSAESLAAQGLSGTRPESLAAQGLSGVAVGDALGFVWPFRPSRGMTRVMSGDWFHND